MIKLLTIIGARPQIIKAAAISRAIRTRFAGEVEEHILHTGQHYDANMSEVFFRELGIPEPDYNLHVGSGTHAVQTAKIMEGIETVLTGERVSGLGVSGEKHSYDGIIVYGDTNSTLAAAVAASKIHVPVFHVEAGLRSFNMSMPEEINRIVCDQLSSVLFTPTLTGLKNLQAEGFPVGESVQCKVYGVQGKAYGVRKFADGREQRVVLSGDVMYDNSMYFSAMADRQSDIIERMGLSYRNFVLATIHRPANTDNPENLKTILRALSDIAEQHQMEVVLPLHPRTRQRLESLTPNPFPEGQGRMSRRIKIIEPASFFEIIRLEKNAAIVMTDSGGVQKEAFFYGTPCVILRPETEWVEIVEAGAGIIADADYDRIMAAYEQLVNKPVTFPALFGDGHASEKIIGEILAYLGV